MRQCIINLSKGDTTVQLNFQYVSIYKHWLWNYRNTQHVLLYSLRLSTMSFLKYSKNDNECCFQIFHVCVFSITDYVKLFQRKLDWIILGKEDQQRLTESMKFSKIQTGIHNESPALTTEYKINYVESIHTICWYRDTQESFILLRFWDYKIIQVSKWWNRFQFSSNNFLREKKIRQKSLL